MFGCWLLREEFSWSCLWKKHVDPIFIHVYLRHILSPPVSLSHTQTHIYMHNHLAQLYLFKSLPIFLKKRNLSSNPLLCTNYQVKKGGHTNSLTGFDTSASSTTYSPVDSNALDQCEFGVLTHNKRSNPSFVSHKSNTHTHTHTHISLPHNTARRNTAG